VVLPGASLCAALVAFGAGHVPSVPIAWPPDEGGLRLHARYAVNSPWRTLRVMDECKTADLDVPGTHLEFEDRFGNEGTCRAYLERVRWPDGFVCPNHDCGGRQAWLTARGLHRCTACGRQTSATAGTMFAATRKPLRAWFEVLWLVAGEDGVSAEALQIALGLGSYQTAWAWLHKVRRALAVEAPERLTGIVELGVISLASVEGSTRRKPTRPTLVATAREVSDPETGGIRLAHVPNSGRLAVERFVAQAVAPGATIRTTLELRPTVAGLGLRLDPVSVRAGRDVGLPYLDASVGWLEDWIVRTHHGAIRRQQLDFYLAEFAFRFNERGSTQGLRFYRLLERGLAVAPTSARALVGGTGATVTAAVRSSPSRAERATPRDATPRNRAV
jgi:Transposase zinc-ribbon domain/ISXO2-like transposase domain